MRKSLRFPPLRYKRDKTYSGTRLWKCLFTPSSPRRNENLANSIASSAEIIDPPSPHRRSLFLRVTPFAHFLFRSLARASCNSRALHDDKEAVTRGRRRALSTRVFLSFFRARERSKAECAKATREPDESMAARTNWKGRGKGKGNGNDTNEREKKEKKNNHYVHDASYFLERVRSVRRVYFRLRDGERGFRAFFSARSLGVLAFTRGRLTKKPGEKGSGAKTQRAEEHSGGKRKKTRELPP